MLLKYNVVPSEHDIWITTGCIFLRYVCTIKLDWYLLVLHTGTMKCCLDLKEIVVLLHAGNSSLSLCALLLTMSSKRLLVSACCLECGVVSPDLTSAYE